MASSPSFPLLFDEHAERLTIDDVASQIFEDSEIVEVWHQTSKGFQNVTYEVSAVPKPFGGFQWYLICPLTKRRARVLYKFDYENEGLFVHRSAFPKACYAIQTQSKIDRTFTSMRKAEAKLQNAAIKPNAKICYRGKLVKRLESAKRRYEITAEIVDANTKRMLNSSAKDLLRMKQALASLDDLK